MGQVVRELPGAVTGVFCAVCRSLIGYCSYLPVTVIVDEDTYVPPPSPWRVVIGGCNGNGWMVHPWLFREVVRSVD